MRISVLREPLLRLLRHLGVFFKWLLLALAVGCAVGAVSALFALGLQRVTAFRLSHGWILFCLPLAGPVIVTLYRRVLGQDGGTDLVLSNIHARQDIPWRVAPVILLATLLTHLCGGSAGREGAALQLGGSLGGLLGRTLHLDEQDRRVTVMCGMAAAFAAVFGTPMAAAVFAMEVAGVGVMYYAALMPCVLSALLASRFSAGMGIHPEHFDVPTIPDLTPGTGLRVLLLAALCAGVATLLCVVLHRTAHLCRRLLPEPYLRAVAGGCLVLLFTLLWGSQDYLGAGVELIERAFAGQTAWYTFLLKLLLTAVTLGCGFRGGEIVPTLCVGATFGCVAGSLLGLPTGLAAACGMVSLFCGATNCPIASLLISFELFGYGGMPFFLISVAVSFLLSGTYGLYHEQTIVYSKYKARLVNQKTRD